MRQRCHVLELAETNPILNESVRVFDFLIIPLAGAFFAARTYDYGACSSHREPKALLNSRRQQGELSKTQFIASLS